MAKKKTNVEKFGDAGRWLADQISDINKGVGKINVPNNVHLWKVADWDWTDYFVWPAEVLGKLTKLSGQGLLITTEYLVRAMNTILVDNPVLRGVEKGLRNKKTKKPGKDELSKYYAKISNAIKDNPTLVAYLVYAAMMVGVITGGKIAYDTTRDDAKEDKKEKIDKTPEKQNQVVMLDPASPDFINQCIEQENILCIPLVYTETHRVEPKVQFGENVWTRGFGMTWSRDKNGRMTIRDYEDSEYNRRKGFKPHKPKKSSGMDEDIEDAQQFLIDHVYSKIKNNMKRPITLNEFYGICIAGYQLPGHIDEICKNLQNAKTPQQIADAFITPNYENYGGTPKRRWVCGMLAAGFITLQDILDADIDNFYEVAPTTLVRKGHFICDSKTIEYVLSIERRQKTGDVIAKLKDGKTALAQLSGQVPVMRVLPVQGLDENVAQATQISESMGLLLDGNKEYKKGNLEQAIKLYQQAIEKDADNMEAYSSLALAYKKQGDKKKSISYYEKCLATVKAGNKRMNQNREMLMDYAIKASSYFNAGVAREEMAKIYEEQGKTVEAKENYTLAKKNYQTALENANTGGLGTKRIEMYKKAIQRCDKKIGKNAKVAFNVADKRIKQLRQNRTASRGDALLYGRVVENTGNDLA
ncbi:MAG: tetratricopeptide repeat protein [Alphaproteobacteria bacterium]|nr:tetratricopeptide repeat protein [Alphaproteobacteria bacterium]